MNHSNTQKGKKEEAFLYRKVTANKYRSNHGILNDHFETLNILNQVRQGPPKGPQRQRNFWGNLIFTCP